MEKKMNIKNEGKLEKIKEFLDKKGLFYIEMANGQLQIDGINFWATTEKFYDPKTGFKGQGINAFMKYLKDNQKL